MRPYPWQSLPRITRSDAQLAARMADRIEALALEGPLAALASLLEVELRIAPGPVGSSSDDALVRTLAPVLVAIAIELDGQRLALELEPVTSLAVIDRVLGGEGVSAPGPSLLSPVEQGVLAFVAARACEGTGAVVIDVLTTREGLCAWLGEGPIAWWSLGVVLGARSSGARIWMPARSLRVAPSTSRMPEALGQALVTLRAEVGRATLAPSELASSAVGDVLLPDTLCAERVGGEPRWSEARLVGPRGAVVVSLERSDGDWRVREIVRAHAVRLAMIVEDAMSESETHSVRTDELSEVAEVPVEIAIELGRVELRVRELAALVPGRVLSARIPVGREVELRAGDRVLATGELVDIEGELGIRITRRG
ncbi:MAG: type III secretion system cytoplasmic ring protein SctQ [Sandaracinaceae bacterium]|nr:type III secretion system cytoplasmic ring protein SctQ [Sandaracinaceae bacterium]